MKLLLVLIVLVCAAVSRELARVLGEMTSPEVSVKVQASKLVVAGREAN